MPALLLNPYVLLGLLLALMGSHWYAYRTGIEREQDAQASRELLIQQAAQSTASLTAETIAKIEVKHVTIRQIAEREIHEKPVYRDCRHTPDGMRVLNAALAGTEPAGDLQLPAAGGPDTR